MYAWYWRVCDTLVLPKPPVFGVVNLPFWITSYISHIIIVLIAFLDGAGFYLQKFLYFEELYSRGGHRNIIMIPYYAIIIVVINKLLKKNSSYNDELVGSTRFYRIFTIICLYGRLNTLDLGHAKCIFYRLTQIKQNRNSHNT